MERKGISIAGNMLCDVVKSLECYPAVGMLADITHISQSVGGCAPNTAMDLAKIDPALPVSVLGMVGDDEKGSYIVDQLERSGIDCSGVKVSLQEPTSFSDVMSLPSGERTFFHCRGANGAFSPEDIPVEDLSCKLFHIGYLLLLDRFDEEDEEYGTVMAKFLHSLQERGIRTSIDAVSSSTLSFEAIIKPALPYCDAVILNEIECCSIWGISPYRGTNPDEEAICRAMTLTMQEGVREKVIVHCKAAGFCLDRSGSFTCVPSLDIPAEEIKGSVGAGDAFCAACLYGLYHGFSDREMLEFASAAAACNLFSENSVDGMRDRKGIEEIQRKYKRKEMKSC